MTRVPAIQRKQAAPSPSTSAPLSSASAVPSAPVAAAPSLAALEHAAALGHRADQVPTRAPGREGAPRPGRSTSSRGGLPVALQRGIERLSGVSLEDVQVRYNSSAPAQLEALAHAQGSEIHVGPGQERHLAHEAWHLVQQRQGRVAPTRHDLDKPVNDDSRLENEADVMGAKAMNTGRAEDCGANCACPGCTGGVTAASNRAPAAKPSSGPPVFQLTCDDGHKQHKKGPCPQSAEGKMARMAGTHHTKTGVSGTPKARLEKWKQKNLQAVQERLAKK